MDKSHISIVPFEDCHIEGSVALSRAEQWPHTPADWRMVANISEGVAVLKDGAVMGTALCTPFGEKLAAFNMIIVASSLRGQGVGRRLMQKLLELAGSRAARLVATEAGYPLYSKVGFVQTGCIHQYQGFASNSQHASVSEVVSASDDDYERVCELDQAISKLDRSTLWGALFACADIKVIRGKDGVEAVASCRDFGRGKVIGPVLAANMQQAQALITAHLTQNPDVFVRIDTPDDSGLGEWLESMGLEYTDQGRVMLRGEMAEGGSEGVYALTSQAVG